MPGKVLPPPLLFAVLVGLFLVPTQTQQTCNVELDLVVVNDNSGAESELVPWKKGGLPEMARAMKVTRDKSPRSRQSC